jgi:hypothetical protein
MSSINSLSIAPPRPPVNSFVSASYSESIVIAAPCNISNCSHVGSHSQSLEGIELLSPDNQSNAVQSVAVPLSNLGNFPMNRVYAPAYSNSPLDNQLDDCS